MVRLEQAKREIESDPRGVTALSDGSAAQRLSRQFEPLARHQGKLWRYAESIAQRQGGTILAWMKRPDSKFLRDLFSTELCWAKRYLAAGLLRRPRNVQPASSAKISSRRAACPEIIPTFAPPAKALTRRHGAALGGYRPKQASECKQRPPSRMLAWWRCAKSGQRDPPATTRSGRSAIRFKRPRLATLLVDLAKLLFQFGDPLFGTLQKLFVGNSARQLAISQNPHFKFHAFHFLLARQPSPVSYSYRDEAVGDLFRAA